MNIHEYQAKEIFKRYGIPVNEGGLALNPQEAIQIARRKSFWDGLYVVKAQVHAGGRGKGGGIKLAHNPEEVRTAAIRLIGSKLVTPQTGIEGRPVDSVIVEFSRPLAKEFYASVVLDRVACTPCLILSEAGGMDIEEVARKTPEKILRIPFDLDAGLSEGQARDAATRLGLPAEEVETFADIFKAMTRIFMDHDCSLVEINPLAVTRAGEVFAIDAKINFDDNALYRHAELEKLRDPRQEDPRENEARQLDLSYVGLHGNIGCVVNGAGLAMATMDIIQFAGGHPANFLDVGGGATQEKVTAAFKLILRDANVSAILVNIFGGIMRCDVVAQGILAAVSEIGIRVPIVVRLEGTNVKEGKELLAKSGLKIITAETFEDAAKKAVEASRTPIA